MKPLPTERQNFPEHFIDIQRQSHAGVDGDENERYDRPKYHLSHIGVGCRAEMPEPKQASARNAKERSKSDNLSPLNAVNIIQNFAKPNFDFFNIRGLLLSILPRLMLTGLSYN